MIRLRLVLQGRLDLGDQWVQSALLVLASLLRLLRLYPLLDLQALVVLWLQCRLLDLEGLEVLWLQCRLLYLEGLAVLEAQSLLEDRLLQCRLLDLEVQPLLEGRLRQCRLLDLEGLVVRLPLEGLKVQRLLGHLLDLERLVHPVVQ